VSKTLCCHFISILRVELNLLVPCIVVWMVVVELKSSLMHEFASFLRSLAFAEDHLCEIFLFTIALVHLSLIAKSYGVINNLSKWVRCGFPVRYVLARLAAKAFNMGFGIFCYCG